MDKHELLEIESCGWNNGEKWCPAEYDGHCMLGDKVDTIRDGVPNNCPLRKSPVLLQLKAEVILHG